MIQMNANWQYYYQIVILLMYSLHWRHNDQGGVSNHQSHGCLLNRLFRRRSKKTSKLCVIGHCAGNSPVPVNSPHKGPVTRKMVPFDDVIMITVMINGGPSIPVICTLNGSPIILWYMEKNMPIVFKVFKILCTFILLSNQILSGSS